jgi:hypothetical protein
MYILVQNLNWFCQKASCTSCLTKLNPGYNKHEPRCEAVETSTTSLMKYQPETHSSHTFHWINKPRIELGLSWILRLHTHCTNAATHVYKTHITKQPRKRNQVSRINACVNLGNQSVIRGRRTSRFLSSWQKQHTSCSLYPSPCPPWRT